MRGALPALALCIAAVAGVGASRAALAQETLSQVAGLYDGQQTEIAALLELGTDGRYRYQLSYGALDEWSAGTWTLVGGAVVLASDPFKAPAFEVRDEGASSGTLTVRMDMSNGADPQYFAVLLKRADGSVAIESMSVNGLTLAMGDNPVVSLRPLLAMFDLTGPAFEVPVDGADVRITFLSNDIGFAGFDGERLVRSGDAYELLRYGRTLRFRKVADVR